LKLGRDVLTMPSKLDAAGNVELLGEAAQPARARRRLTSFTMCTSVSDKARSGSGQGTTLSFRKCRVYTGIATTSTEIPASRKRSTSGPSSARIT
jgi:hypothetical protein